ncbi:glycosyl hydrolase 115 family protein [Galbibacter sp. EGI 63066]|uniref:glycosyl hydrolase 115 family protein n=1 Tax=Galbibacter sp. EGI 63066 TaxID=2993559 RepID=UPI0022495870|nr:glycosyl hydrolase 115 family protein [Galbibacter sp. EGI 63066]MCX2678671.1 glycosyl hydrolase 115 family protein [Galbibacter sp. EGI 63066]
MIYNIYKVAIALFLFTFGLSNVQAQISLVNAADNAKETFTLVEANNTTTIYYDSSDFEVVHIASKLLAEDVERVTGEKPKVSTEKPKSKTAIIVGTIGSSKIIDRLVKKGKLSVDGLKGSWEKYLYKTIKEPLPNVDEALVIVGSDRRGTVYGIFDLSKAIGVSPWYWWADVPAVKRKELKINAVDFVSKEPTVKYRGIFLNDEDWGLKPWASKLMDPEINDIGPKTYAKVFELLLRLKGNMLAPAMHEVTGAFFKYPENKVVADKYAIMMTSSHAEPLLYNNTTEWHHDINGDWDYVRNKEGVLAVLDKRVSEAAPYENIYTVGMRGIHDSGMSDVPEGYTKANVLEQVIDEERGILTKYIKEPAHEIPQVFVPYKEVLGIYESGMELPNDITIVWPDDNYGYIKKLSNTEEQKRSGGAGVYYHESYLGWPNDYLWLNTTNPALMYAEMQKAYTLGAKQYWLLNVGDIKPGEMGMQMFLDMAWNIDAFNFENASRYQVDQLSSIFGEKHKKELARIFDRYYFHSFTRKPEYMSWDWKWNSLFQHPKIKDTEFSFVNYNEAENRLNEYTEIANKAEAILNQLPEELKAAFFELVYYPVKGASLYNHKMLIAQKNRWYAKQGRAMTNTLVQKVQSYHDSIALITTKYNNQLNGKWEGMMTAPGFLPTPQLPPTQQIKLSQKPEMGLFIENQAHDSLQTYQLPQFNKYFDKSHFFEIYNRGALPFTWKATPSEDWIKLDRMEGTTDTQQRIQVSIDWNKIVSTETAKGKILVTDGKQTKRIEISAIAPQVGDNSLYIENNEVISINPTKFHRKKENGDIKFTAIKGLGYSNASLQLGNAKYDSGKNSYVAYDFYADKAGEVTIYTYMLPLFAKDRSHSTRYGIQVDDMAAITQSNDVGEYSEEWASNVIRNSAINKTKFVIDTPGKHTLKLFSIDPGMIVQKIIIDLGGLKDSYIGPDISKTK